MGRAHLVAGGEKVVVSYVFFRVVCSEGRHGVSFEAELAEELFRSNEVMDSSVLRAGSAMGWERTE